MDTFYQQNAWSVTECDRWTVSLLVIWCCIRTLTIR